VSGENPYRNVTETTEPSSSTDTLDLLQYLRLAQRYRWWLAAGLLGGLLLGLAVYLKLGPAYEATTRILVSKKVNVPLRDDSTPTYGERGEHIALIMSPFIVGKAVQMHRLDRLPSLAKSKEPVQDILESLTVKRSAGHDQSFLNIIDITYRNRNKSDARTVVAAIVDAYRSYLRESAQEHTSEVVALITKANKELLQQLRQKEKEYLAFRESAPLLWRSPPGVDTPTSDVVNTHLDNLQAIEAERRKNLLKRTELESKIKTLEEARASGQSPRSLELLVRLLMANAGNGRAPAPEVASTASGLETQLLPLLTRREQLLRDFGPDHPAVQSVQKSIETVVNFYRSRGVVVPDELVEGLARTSQPKNQTTSDLFTAYLGSLRQQLTELQYQDEQLANLQQREAELAKQLARYQAQDQTYHDDIARIKELWNVVVRRLNELNLVKDSQGYSLKQIAPIRVELHWKRVLKIVGAGVFLGLVVVCLLIYVNEQRDTTLKSVDEIQKLLGQPVLGAIPRFEVDRQAPGPLDPSLRYFYYPASIEAEAYRAVRITLLSELVEGGERVVQVSSPEPGDGKTTFVANLALSLAQTGRRVLLLDADLRRPRTHTLFGVQRETGLAEVVEGRVSLRAAVKETAMPNLWLLTAGAPVAQPAELLSEPGFRRALNAARDEFDLVLVDSPPVLVVSDTSIIAQQVDGLLLVLQLGKNLRATVRRALERLKANHVRVLGAVANALEATSEDGYAYGYAYGDVYSQAAADRDGFETSDAAGQREDAPTSEPEPPLVAASNDQP